MDGQMRANWFVDWTPNGGTRSCHSSQLNAPFRFIHGRRYS
jgi:hypothetical protein